MPGGKNTDRNQETGTGIVKRMSQILRVQKWQIAFVMNCNLRCAYCYTSHGRFDGPAGVMGRRQQQLLLEILRKTEEPVFLEFGTGETFLAFDEFLAFIDAFQAARPDYAGKDSVSVTTNGTLLDHGKIEKLVQRGVSVVFSIDGNKLVHRTQRKDVNGKTHHRKILSNYDHYLSCIKAAGIVQNTTVVSVLTGGNSLADVENFWKERGGKLYSVTLEWPQNTGEKALKEFQGLQNRYLADLENLANEKARQYNVLSFLDDFSGPMELFEGWRNLFLDRKKQCCGPLRNFFAVNSFGDIYPCELLMDDPRFLLGTLEEGIHIDLYEKVSRIIHDFEKKERRYLENGAAVSTCFVQLFPLFQTEQGRQYGSFFTKVNHIIRNSYEELCS